jgi:hypothetical protein
MVKNYLTPILGIIWDCYDSQKLARQLLASGFYQTIKPQKRQVTAAHRSILYRLFIKKLSLIKKQA